MATGESVPPRDLPEGFDPRLMIGRRLDHVTFTAFTVQFLFDGREGVGGDPELVLADCHCLDHFVPDSSPERIDFDDGPIASSQLTRLCGRTVTDCAADTLRLTFDDGQVLALVPIWDGYEEYVIHIGGKTFVMGPRRHPG